MSDFEGYKYEVEVTFSNNEVVILKLHDKFKNDQLAEDFFIEVLNDNRTIKNKKNNGTVYFTDQIVSYRVYKEIYRKSKEV